MNGNKKLLVPVVALMLCAVAVIGIGFAYQGTYSDKAASEDMDVHWVKVGSDKQIAIDATGLAVDVDTVTSGYGPSAVITYTLSPNQSHGEYNATDKTVTFKHVSIGILKFDASGADVTGALSIVLKGNDVNGVKVVLDGTYDSFDTSKDVEVFVNIIVSESAVAGTEPPSVSTPAFTMDVKATVEE